MQLCTQCSRLWKPHPLCNIYVICLQQQQGYFRAGGGDLKSQLRLHQVQCKQKWHQNSGQRHTQGGAIRRTYYMITLAFWHCLYLVGTTCLLAFIFHYIQTWRYFVCTKILHKILTTFLQGIQSHCRQSSCLHVCQVVERRSQSFYQLSCKIEAYTMACRFQTNLRMKTALHLLYSNACCWKPT